MRTKPWVVGLVGIKGDQAPMIIKLREQLAAFKTSKARIFFADLPRNAMGKVRKNLLRKMLAGAFS